MTVEPAPHLTLTRRRVVVLALVVPLTGAVLYGLLPRLTGLDDTWGRLERGQPSWLGLALGCEVLSFASYVVLFRGVFARDRRIGCGASFEISLAGVAATRLLAAGGAGGVAVTVWRSATRASAPGEWARRCQRSWRCSTGSTWPRS